MSTFAEATRVVPRAVAGEFDVDLHERWSVADTPHGGYLLAVLAEAARAVAGENHPHLTAVSATFVRAPQPGPAVATVEVLGTGRAATQVRATLAQDGAPKVVALITQGLLTDDDPWWSRRPPAEMPDPDACLPAGVRPIGAGFEVALMEYVDSRVDPDSLRFATDKPTGRGLVKAYQRLRDGTDWDPSSLLVPLDFGPPASFDLGITGTVKTMQLTAFVRVLPAPGAVLCELQANQVDRDRMDETITLWDSKGRMVGQSHQIAMVRVPDRPGPLG